MIESMSRLHDEITSERVLEQNRINCRDAREGRMIATQSYSKIDEIAMNEDAILHIRDNLRIPMHELTFRASRSSGPGGQHVNRSETRVELLWDVRNSPSLSKTQRYRIEQHLAGRIDKDGVLHLVSGERRSQWQNKQAVIERFVHLLREATTPRKRRLPTKPSEAARERRLREKRRRSEIKKARGKVTPGED